MKYKMQTFIDITETNVRRQDPDKYKSKQQSNFETVIQTIGLRSNLDYTNSPSFDNITVDKLTFGDKYKGKQNVWTFEFGIEYEGGLTLDMLTSDFDLIPIITGLDETVQLDKALFRTSGKDKNIVFSVVD